MMTTEKKLLQRFNQGDEQAFNEVFKLHYRSLCYYMHKFPMSYEEAEDIVSETFIKIFTIVRGGKQFKSTDHIKNAIFIMSRNAAINHLNLVKRRSGYIKDFLILAGQENHDDSRNHRVETELLQCIYEAVETLPAECKKIFKLFYLREYSSREVAARLNLHPQTVRNQVNRAITLLKKYLSATHTAAMTEERLNRKPVISD